MGNVIFQTVLEVQTGPACGLNFKNANFPDRAPVLSALCIISQTWSTIKIPPIILTKFHTVWMIICIVRDFNLGDFLIYIITRI